MKTKIEKLNILLVDDVQNWLNFHKENLNVFLKNYEFEIFEFQSAKEAYQFAINTNTVIDIVISDLQMEDMEKYAGMWLVENLKMLKSTQNAKYIIVSSAYEIEQIAKELEVSSIHKRLYYNNPFVLKLKLEEMYSGLELFDEF